MVSGLDKSLNEIIRGGYGADRPKRGNRNRSVPYTKSNGTSVYVGNLPWDTNWPELKELCQEYGDVQRADVMEYPDGKSKGWGLVTFADSTGAEACIDGLNGYNLNGRELNVKFDEKGDNGFSGNTSRSFSGNASRSFSTKGGSRSFSSMGGNSGGCQVFVGNLPFSVRWQILKDMCKKFGYVVRATIEENENGYSKGYGIVVFDNETSARNCIKALDGSLLDGRQLVVKFDEKTQRGGGAFSGGRNLGSQMVGNHLLMSDESSHVDMGGDSSQLWVGNIPYEMTWQDLKDMCKKYGFVQNVDIMMQNGRSAGQATVLFNDQESAQACIDDLNGATVDGREIIVKFDDKYDGGAGSGSTTVFVGNLPWSTQWHELKGMCQSFGNVAFVDIPENDNGGSRGFATVRFDDSISAQKCVQHLNGKQLEGRQLNVRFDKFEGTSNRTSNSNESATVFVGNLPYTFNKWSDMKELCRNFGDVQFVDIPETEDGRSKGFATVKFGSSDGAQKCIEELDGKLLNGRRLHVRFDKFDSKFDS